MSDAFRALQLRVFMRSLRETVLQCRDAIATSSSCGGDDDDENDFGHSNDPDGGDAAAPTTATTVATAAGSASVDFLRALLLSAIPVIRAAPEGLLPWRGCDVARAQRCGVEARVAVVVLAVGAEAGAVDPPGHGQQPLRTTTTATIATTRPSTTTATVGINPCTGETQRVEEEEETQGGPEVPHSAVDELRETILGLCDIAAAHTETASPSSSSSPLASSSPSLRRLCLLAAVELVDCLNNSTDYDELGFPCLAQLCRLLRPGQEAHVQSETRWAYLRDMRLHRRWLIHGTESCPGCLGRHDSDTPCDV